MMMVKLFLILCNNGYTVPKIRDFSYNGNYFSGKESDLFVKKLPIFLFLF